MIQLHFDPNQLNLGKSTCVLHYFAWNYVNYANMEGFRRDSHICRQLFLVLKNSNSSFLTRYRDACGYITKVWIVDNAINAL